MVPWYQNLGRPLVSSGPVLVFLGLDEAATPEKVFAYVSLIMLRFDDHSLTVVYLLMEQFLPRYHRPLFYLEQFLLWEHHHPKCRTEFRK